MASALRRVFGALRGQHGGVAAFLLQFDTGGMLVLEMMSSAAALGAPLILHRFLRSTDSVSLASAMVLCTLLATLCGRAKDQLPDQLRSEDSRCLGLGIAVLTFGVMGWTSVFGFGLVAVIFVGQTALGRRIGQAVGGYVRHNDARLGAYRDLLNNIQGVKATAIEDVFQRKITRARSMQLEALRYWLRTSFAMFTAVNQTMPYLAACAAFLAYAMSGAKLTADAVFPCLAYFQMLYQPVTLASLAFSRQFSVRPSLGRVHDLLTAQISCMLLPEAGSEARHSAISFQSASFEWPRDEKDDAATLDVGSLEIPRNQLTAVIGRNGAGKTSLLLAMLGEMDLSLGSYQLNGHVAYCSQNPWVMSGALRDNIVFNNSRGYDARRYDAVVSACGLNIDFANIPGGTRDATVGESGSNLSGGQRARVSLARAIYSDPDILLLDDPLSALDAHVRVQLFGSLRAMNKTIVLVTLHTLFVSQMDHVIVVDDNKVRWSGPKQAFLAQSWSSEFLGLEESHQRPKHSGKSDNGLSSGDDVGLADDVTDGVGGDIDGIWQQEERAQGAVQVVVAKFYIAMSGGGPYAGLVMAMTCILTASKVLSQYWFVWWIADSIGLSQQQYMGSFLGLTLLQGLVTSVVGLTLVRTSLRAAQAVHETILSNIIAAPLWLFHQNPTGRILNRLSKDIEAMDSRIMNAVDGLLGAGTTMLASVSIVAASGVFLIAVIFPFLLVVGYCLHRFRVTAREVQRLDAVLQSPALSLVTESLKAPSSLAAASVLLVLVILTLNGIIPQVSASLALATATTLARQVYLLAWACTDLEIHLNALERLQTYHARIRREGPEPDPSSTDGHDDNGLSCTDIVIKDASLKYKTRKTPALDKVSLTFRSGEKVGLIGRTGSGKSTLISVISRLVDIQDGKIYLAGLDTSTIEPRKLRRMVSTLPQETLIFQGTLRENIDSRRQRSDGDIWTALDACQMSSVLKAKYGENALDQELSSDGTDLSAGQRQLVCAARVVLEQPAVLLVDEASANVDFASDEALQRAWQALPSETTVIMIAHRASSLAWMDRILVMDNGRVVEDGSPADLLGRHDSYYRSSILQDGRMALHNAMQTAESHRAGK
ncbi:hypothetical protein NHJ13051_009346 [Beauveria bassiana]